MENNYVKISIKPETKNLFKKCYDEYLDVHPEFKGMFLSENFMLDKICTYYLNH